MLDKGVVLQERYEIDMLLGEGGFGAVYKANDRRLKKAVAVKEMLHQDTKVLRHFEREAELLARMRHPSMTAVTDYFAEGTTYYLVMEYVSGEDLGQYLSRWPQGALMSETQALQIINPVIDAVEYLHRQNPPIIHRDIKPANIRLSTDDSVYLVDFGIAKVYDAQNPGTMSMLAHTPGFAPIEQYDEGLIDPRSDLYAIGATLYTMLTREPPPQAPSRVLKDTLVPPRQYNPAISPQLERIVMRLLALRPEDRYQSVAELRQDMAKLQVAVAPAVGATTGAVAGSGEQAEERSRPPAWLWAAIGGGGAVIIVMILVVLLVLGGAPDTPAVATGATTTATATSAATPVATATAEEAYSSAKTTRTPEEETTPTPTPDEKQRKKAWYADGLDAFDEGDWETASELLAQVYEIDSDYLTTPETLASAYFNWGKQYFEEAKESLDKEDAENALEKVQLALEINPDDKEAGEYSKRLEPYVVARNAFEEQDWKTSAISFEVLLEVQGNSDFLDTAPLLYQAYLSYAAQREDEGDEEHAFRLYEKASNLYEEAEPDVSQELVAQMESGLDRLSPTPTPVPVARPRPRGGGSPPPVEEVPVDEAPPPQQPPPPPAEPTAVPGSFK